MDSLQGMILPLLQENWPALLSWLVTVVLAGKVIRVSNILKAVAKLEEERRKLQKDGLTVEEKAVLYDQQDAILKQLGELVKESVGVLKGLFFNKSKNKG